MARLRAALAAHDAELGLVWMYDHATVCQHWDALDAAFDTLSAARQAVGIDEELLEQSIAEAVKRIEAGDSSGRALLISLLGDTAGQVLTRILRRTLRQSPTKRVTLHHATVTPMHHTDTIPSHLSASQRHLRPATAATLPATAGRC